MSLKSGLIIKAGTSGTGQTAHWEMTVGGIDGRFWVHEKKIIPMGCVRGVRQLWRCQTTLKMVSKIPLKEFYKCIIPQWHRLRCNLYTLLLESALHLFGCQTPITIQVSDTQRNQTPQKVWKIFRKRDMTICRHLSRCCHLSQRNIYGVLHC